MSQELQEASIAVCALHPGQLLTREDRPMLSIKPDLVDYAMINSALVRPIKNSTILIKSMKMAIPLIKYRSISKLQAKSMYIDEEYIEIYYKESLLLKGATFNQIMEENMSYQIPENFKNASGQILVTVGEKEKSIMKKSFTDILNSNSSAKGIIIPKIGHGISLAKPDLFNKLVEDWITENYEA